MAVNKLELFKGWEKVGHIESRFGRLAIVEGSVADLVAGKIPTHKIGSGKVIRMSNQMMDRLEGEDHTDYES